MRLVVAFLLAASLGAAQSWRTAAELPGLSFEGLSGTQRQAVLRVLRSFDCVCGCNMKLAQCRVEDPPCTYSKTLAELAVATARQGKPEAAIRQALEDSRMVRQARQRNRILLDPVALRIDGAPVKGAAQAKVTLVEFSDFQCPYCATAVAKLDAILQAYPKDVRLVFKQFPLEKHSLAALAAAASLAAHAQGRFWPMHDKMYANWRQISAERLVAWARECGLDVARFSADMNSVKMRAAVAGDLNDGIRAGVEGTPSVFINGKQYRGALEAAEFRTLIEAEIKAR